MYSIYQGRFFGWRSLRAEDTVVYYTLARFGQVREVAIAYEELIGPVTRWDVSYPWLARLGGFALAFGLAMAAGRWWQGEAFGLTAGLSLLAGKLLLAAYVVSRASYWRIYGRGGQDLYLYTAVPDESSVATFIRQLFGRRDTYLRAQYGQVSRLLDYQEQVANLRMLRMYRVIGEEEFLEREAELNRLFGKASRRIGFFAE